MNERTVALIATFWFVCAIWTTLSIYQDSITKKTTAALRVLAFLGCWGAFMLHFLFFFAKINGYVVGQ